MCDTEEFRLHNHPWCHMRWLQTSLRENMLFQQWMWQQRCIGCHTPLQECRQPVERCVISMSPVAGPERQIQSQLVQTYRKSGLGQTGSNQFTFVWWWGLSLASGLCLSHQAIPPLVGSAYCNSNHDILYRVFLETKFRKTLGQTCDIWVSVLHVPLISVSPSYLNCMVLRGIFIALYDNMASMISWPNPGTHFISSKYFLSLTFSVLFTENIYISFISSFRPTIIEAISF